MIDKTPERGLRLLYAGEMGANCEHFPCQNEREGYGTGSKHIMINPYVMKGTRFEGAELGVCAT